MKRIIYFFIFQLIAITSLAQTYVNDKPLLKTGSPTTASEQLNLISNESFYKTPSQSAAVSRNLVLIDQVGVNNIGLISTTSNDSEISLFQSGTNNRAFIELNAKTIRENVVQIGNDNYFQDYSIHGAQLHTASIFQEGSYNKIISTGKNSLSERIEITQKGVGKEAYIIHN
ncbi:hypothetical protein [Nonlabens marinus]|nr:hypothetical protein [Nonlabens marinus]